MCYWLLIPLCIPISNTPVDVLQEQQLSSIRLQKGQIFNVCTTYFQGKKKKIKLYIFTLSHTDSVNIYTNVCTYSVNIYKYILRHYIYSLELSFCIDGG